MNGGSPPGPRLVLASLRRMAILLAVVLAAALGVVWAVQERLVFVPPRDDVAPPAMGRAVFAAAQRKGELLVVADAGHGDVADRGGERYWAWLGRALSARWKWFLASDWQGSVSSEHGSVSSDADLAD